MVTVFFEHNYILLLNLNIDISKKRVPIVLNVTFVLGLLVYLLRAPIVPTKENKASFCDISII